MKIYGVDNMKAKLPRYIFIAIVFAAIVGLVSFYLWSNNSTKEVPKRAKFVKNSNLDLGGALILKRSRFLFN